MLKKTQFWSIGKMTSRGIEFYDSDCEIKILLEN